MFSRRTNWPLETNPLSQSANRRRQSGLPLLDLTESNPTRCGFEYDAVEILKALIQPSVLRYDPDPHGPAEACRAVTEYYAAHDAKLDARQLFMTSSTSEAYSFLFRLLADPGEHILIPQPGYPLFDYLAPLNDVRCVSCPLIYEGCWRIDQGLMAKLAASRPKAIVAVHPNNPTGSFVHADEAGFLANLCREQEIALVTDEVFCDYPHPGKANGRAPTFASERRALAFTLSGLSKICALPQMKCSWIVVNGPDDLREQAIQRLEIIADTYLSLSAPVAHALPELLRLRNRIQSQILTRVTQNLGRLDDLIDPTSPVSRFEVEGGWNAVLRVPAIRTDEEWSVRLVETDGVLVHPGHFYGFSVEGCLVLSLLPPTDLFEEGARKIMARVLEDTRA